MPNTVKHWGLWPITKRRYVLSLMVVALTCLASLGVYALLPRPLPMPTADEEAFVQIAFWLIAHTPWLIAAAVTGTTLDAVFLLSRFAGQVRERETASTSQS